MLKDIGSNFQNLILQKILNIKDSIVISENNIDKDFVRIILIKADFYTWPLKDDGEIGSIGKKSGKLNYLTPSWFFIEWQCVCKQNPPPKMNKACEAYRKKQ